MRNCNESLMSMNPATAFWQQRDKYTTKTVAWFGENFANSCQEDKQDKRVWSSLDHRQSGIARDIYYSVVFLHGNIPLVTLNADNSAKRWSIWKK